MILPPSTCIQGSSLKPCSDPYPNPTPYTHFRPHFTPTSETPIVEVKPFIIKYNTNVEVKSFTLDYTSQNYKIELLTPNGDPSRTEDWMLMKSFSEGEVLKDNYYRFPRRRD